MEMYGSEKVWCYLHDDARVVSPTLYFEDKYHYASELVKLLDKNRDYINEITNRMIIERLNDDNIFLQARNGFGKTEHRIFKLMSIEGVGDILKEMFPELVLEEIPQIKK